MQLDWSAGLRLEHLRSAGKLLVTILGGAVIIGGLVVVIKKQVTPPSKSPSHRDVGFEWELNNLFLAVTQALFASMRPLEPWEILARGEATDLAALRTMLEDVDSAATAFIVCYSRIIVLRRVHIDPRDGVTDWHGFQLPLLQLKLLMDGSEMDQMGLGAVPPSYIALSQELQAALSESIMHRSLLGKVRIIGLRDIQKLTRQPGHPVRAATDIVFLAILRAMEGDWTAKQVLTRQLSDAMECVQRMEYALRASWGPAWGGSRAAAEYIHTAAMTRGFTSNGSRAEHDGDQVG